MHRPEILRKLGKEVTSYQDETPVIRWTILLNEARHSIDRPVLSDTIPEGLVLVFDSIKVLDSAWNEVPADEYTVEETADGFALYFHREIFSYYTIEYETLVLDLEKETFVNNAQLIANEIGTGEPIVVKRPVSSSIFNTYDKDEVEETVAATEYHKVDYQEKTMSWKLTVDAKKEVITELTIYDEFIPEKSMKFLADTLVVVKSGVSDEKEVVSQDQYTITDSGVHGFTLVFQGELERAKYEIYYKTSFDVNQVSNAGGVINTTREYSNRATFSGKTRDSKGKSHSFETTREASYFIEERVFNSGYKAGNLLRDDRKIQWEVFVNMQGQDFSKKAYNITDTLSPGQVFIPDSLQIAEYSLTKTGTPVAGEDIDSSRYTIAVSKEGDSFTITFADGISGPIMLTYATSIVGISEKEYSNTATTLSGGRERTYHAKVTYPGYDQFVSKELVGQATKVVYPDDLLQWDVTLNHSLSEINNATFTDTMSLGHEYVIGSLRVYKGERSDNTRQTALESKLQVETTPAGETNLVLALGDIDTTYIIIYETVVTSKVGTIANKATLLGDEISSNQSSEKEFEIRKNSWGMGSGVNKGSLQIIKFDKNQPEKVLAGAGFELWYLLNGKERQVEYNGETVFYTDENGRLTFLDLINNREYIVKEVIAPSGYRIAEESIPSVVAHSGERAVVEVPNEKLYGSIKIIKRDQETNIPLEGATFALSTKDGQLLAEKTTTADGVTVFEPLEQGEYIIKEVKAPEGYLLAENKVEFAITTHNQRIEHTVFNQPIALEPTNPEDKEPPVPPEPTNPNEKEPPVPTEPEIPTPPTVSVPPTPDTPVRENTTATIVTDTSPNILKKHKEISDKEMLEQETDDSADNPNTGGSQSLHPKSPSHLKSRSWAPMIAVLGGIIVWIAYRIYRRNKRRDA